MFLFPLFAAALLRCQVIVSVLPWVLFRTSEEWMKMENGKKHWRWGNEEQISSINSTCVYSPTLNSLLVALKMLCWLSLQWMFEEDKSKQKRTKRAIPPNDRNSHGTMTEKLSIDRLLCLRGIQLSSFALRSLQCCSRDLVWGFLVQGRLKNISSLVNSRANSSFLCLIFNWKTIQWNFFFHFPDGIFHFFFWKLKIALAAGWRSLVWLHTQRNNSWWMMDASRSEKR